MWICSTIGFFSIVEKKRNEFHVRARAARDLTNLATLVKRETGAELPKIIKTPEADYRWRVVVPKQYATAVLIALGTTIDYRNFKDAVGEDPQQSLKLGAYGDFWRGMMRIQEDAAR